MMTTKLAIYSSDVRARASFQRAIQECRRVTGKARLSSLQLFPAVPVIPEFAVTYRAGDDFKQTMIHIPPDGPDCESFNINIIG